MGDYIFSKINMQVHYFTAIFIFMFTIKGSQSQYNCCKKKELNGITYVLTKYSGLNPDPSCLNDCIYQIEGNNDKYFCFGQGESTPQCIAEDYYELSECPSDWHSFEGKCYKAFLIDEVS